MFKNLKKKIEDVGADLSTISSVSSLGSSRQSLKTSDSKASTIAGSKESIYSEKNTRTRSDSTESDHQPRPKELVVASNPKFTDTSTNVESASESGRLSPRVDEKENRTNNIQDPRSMPFSDSGNPSVDVTESSYKTTARDIIISTSPIIDEEESPSEEPVEVLHQPSAEIKDDFLSEDVQASEAAVLVDLSETPITPQDPSSDYPILDLMDTITQPDSSTMPENPLQLVATTTSEQKDDVVNQDQLVDVEEATAEHVDSKNSGNSEQKDHVVNEEKLVDVVDDSGTRGLSILANSEFIVQPQTIASIHDAAVPEKQSAPMVESSPTSVLEQHLEKEMAALLKSLETSKLHVKEKDDEISQLRSEILRVATENSALKSDVGRLKEEVSKRSNAETRLKDALAKSQDRVSASKLEMDSWKIANEQAIRQAKEKDQALATSAKKHADLEAKLASAKTYSSEQEKEIRKLKNETTELKDTISLLEKQLDKLLADYQSEKQSKEGLAEQLQDMNRLRAVIEDQRREIDRLKQEKDADVAKLRADKEQDLSRIRRVMEETTRNLQADAEVKASASLSQLRDQERIAQETSDRLQTEIQRRTELETTVTMLEERIKTLQEDLEGKESSLAIFRRRTAKETETKLRERDKQIAFLERQVEELLEKANSANAHDNTEDTGQEYTKNVMLRFIAASGEERMQMLRAVSVLLKLNQTEEQWLKDTLIWKQSWLPGPKPELNPPIPPHFGTSNGHG